MTEDHDIQGLLFVWNISRDFFKFLSESCCCEFVWTVLGEPSDHNVFSFLQWDMRRRRSERDGGVGGSPFQQMVKYVQGMVLASPAGNGTIPRPPLIFSWNNMMRKENLYFKFSMIRDSRLTSSISSMVKNWIWFRNNSQPSTSDQEY